MILKLNVIPEFIFPGYFLLSFSTKHRIIPDMQYCKPIWFIPLRPSAIRPSAVRPSANRPSAP